MGHQFHRDLLAAANNSNPVSELTTKRCCRHTLVSEPIEASYKFSNELPLVIFVPRFCGVNASPEACPLNQTSCSAQQPVRLQTEPIIKPTREGTLRSRVFCSPAGLSNSLCRSIADQLEMPWGNTSIVVMLPTNSSPEVEAKNMQKKLREGQST
jgi:hypothetical protein